MQEQYIKEDTAGILDQQIIIAQLSNGIGFKDSNDMDSFERLYVLKKLIAVKKEEIEAQKKAIQNAKKK